MIIHIATIYFMIVTAVATDVDAIQVITNSNINTLAPSIRTNNLVDTTTTIDSFIFTTSTYSKI
jgi:hypothetical protein